MSSTKSPEEQAAERHPNDATSAAAYEKHLRDGLPLETMPKDVPLVFRKIEREAYAAALRERAIPAEQALQVAMDYIKAASQEDADLTGTMDEAWEALRANPITAKMLEE